MFSSFLDDVGSSGESAVEFLALYSKLFAKDHWIYYLAVKGIPIKISQLISKVRKSSLSGVMKGQSVSNCIVM